MANPRFPKKGGVIVNVDDFSCPNIADYSGDNAKTEFHQDHGDYYQSKANRSYRLSRRASDPRVGAMDDTLLTLRQTGLADKLPKADILQAVNAKLTNAKLAVLTVEEFAALSGIKV